ncbi:MAG: phosphoribosylamine--glycine ligase [Acidimicrobiales bacterium]
MGSGGREHALAVALARTAEVVVAPGNRGMALLGTEVTGESPLSVGADLFVIGPEVELASGLGDRLRAEGRRVFGPGADGAMLETSKAWMKDLLSEAGVPTARYGVFDSVEPAVELVSGWPGPCVVKTDGLASGKGVTVCASVEEAVVDLEEKLSGRAFGDAGRRVVVEEALQGRELSVMALTDGRRLQVLPAARDHKRALDGDQGPNTGGMGAYSPVADAGPALVGEIMDKAIEPVLWALRRRGIDYRGVLYAGVMLTEEGPKVLEFNVRFGDPEAQAVLPLLGGDLAGLLRGAADGEMREVGEMGAAPPGSCACVVACTEGYPESPVTGDEVHGLEGAAKQPGTWVLSAGIGAGPGSEGLTAGGRAVNVCGVGPNLDDATRLAYATLEMISWRGMRYRRDIGSAA